MVESKATNGTQFKNFQNQKIGKVCSFSSQWKICANLEQEYPKIIHTHFAIKFTHNLEN
jgi:hypothetical protein